jgi:hypothetical protein
MSTRAATAAMDALILLEAMGLLDDGPEVEALDLDAVRRVASVASSAGIGGSAAARLGASRLPDPDEIAELLEEIHVALEGSPLPETEWRAMHDLFGADRLAGLVGVSVASLRRYLAGQRPTPDVVAARLHVLTQVVADLRGAYSEVGVRRWFERKRTQLDGRTPGELLTGEWDPDGDDAHAVLPLARALAGSPAT